MEFASLALAVEALSTGLIAAAFWFKASAVKIEPELGTPTGGMAVATTPWVAGTLDALATASRLNTAASIWTAVSVVLSALSSVAGQVLNYAEDEAEEAAGGESK